MAVLHGFLWGAVCLEPVCASGVGAAYGTRLTKPLFCPAPAQSTVADAGCLPEENGVSEQPPGVPHRIPAQDASTIQHVLDQYTLLPQLFARRYNQVVAVAVAQLVESRIVIPVVVGSSPISHPI
jgi:hypothetical protein